MIIHITPVGDLREHLQDTMCECRPVVQMEESGDIICIHNSYDGREGLELANEVLGR